MATESGKSKYNKYGQPSLDLVFTGTKKSLKDRSGNTQVEFTRDTIGTYVDENGIIKTAAVDEARFDHDPVTGESLGLLVEESRTNYCKNYSAFYYGYSNATIASGLSPAGDNKAQVVTVTANGMTSARPTGSIKSANIPTNSVGITCSLYVKGSYSYFRLKIFAGTSTRQQVIFYNFNTDSWTVSSNNSANRPSSNYQVQDAGNGWYRLSFYASNYTAAQGIGHMFDGSASLSAGDTYSVWMPQVEIGTFPTSAIPTEVASEATRAADIAQITTADIYGDEFTIINKPFGASSGAASLSFIGPSVKRTTVYSSNLSQTNINAFVDKTDEFWQWRILGSSFALPTFTTDGQVTVDWGDGTIEVLTTGEHTFTNGDGYHEIGFRLDSGTYFRPRINGNSTHKDKLIAIGPAPESMKIRAQEAFNGCTNLQAFDPTIAANGETNYSYAWQSCSSLKNFPLIDTSGVTYMLRTWRFCSGLENFAKIDTSSVTGLYEAWDSCSSLTSFPVIDTSNVTDFSEAWSGCSSLTEFPVLDTSKGTSFSATWQSCSSLTEFPSQIDVSKCSNFNTTWRYCSGLISFPELDFSSATNFSYAWMGCSSLTSFPTLSTTSLVQNFSGPWYACSGLTTIPICDYSSATTFNGAWVNCSNLTTIPANLFDTTGTLVATAFGNAFTNDKLSAQSIENLLVSLVANGATGVTLNMIGGSNANTSTWSTAANNAYLELVNNRGWIITQNGTAPT